MAGEVTNRDTEAQIDLTAHGRRIPAARRLSWAALAGVALTLAIFAALHLLPPTSQISPVHRTISEYALTSSAWAFNLGVIALAAASAAVLAGTMMSRRLPVASAGTIFGALWVAGLLTVVSFPKHTGGPGGLGGPSSGGQIHRMASLVAFLAFPIAVLLIARRRGRAANPAPARWALALAVLSLAWFSPIVIAVLTAPRAWWQQIPLGLIERGLALTEVLAVVALALLVRADSSPADPWRPKPVRSAAPRPTLGSGSGRRGSTRQSAQPPPAPTP